MRAPVAFGPLRIAAVAALLTVAAASSSAAGDRCLSHFPELRAFVDLAGTRGTPDEDTAAALADELAVERALWADEADHNRQRLAAAGAGAGLDRLDAVDAELGTLFDTFEAMLSGRGPLDEVVVDRLLECGGAGGPRWPIRSGSAPLPEAPPEHRRPRLAEAPPASYHQPPGGALRSAVKAAPDQVWPEDPLDPVVVKAAELGLDPVALYRFVLNGVRAEAYVGTLKSPAVVLASGGGNDADQAALLAELLRASGYPARIAWGVVEVPTSRLLRHFNIADTEALEALLTTVGIAWEPVAVGGQPAAYRIERFWCELWIPYGNFRGLELDGSGETWAVLDPTLESRGPPNARRVLNEIGLDPEVFLDDYLSGGLCGPDLLVPSACPDPRTLVETQVDQYLAGINDPESYASLAASPAAETDELPILAASMPGHVVSVSWVGLEPPAEWRHRLHLRATAGGSVLLDATVDLAAITGREAALWYEPATEDDEAIVRAFDGDLWQVPPYLVNVTPTLIRRGGEVARGIAGIGMGRAFELEATVISPSGSTVGFANHEVAGAPTILAPAAGATGYRVLGDEPGSSLELLSTLADEHMSRSRRFAEELAVLAGLGVGFPLPTVAFLGNEVEVDGALGLIQSLDWRGLVVDVDVWGPRAAGGTADDRRAWRTLAQLDASVSERAIFEDAGVLSVSADLALVRAERLGVQVVRIDQANLASVLPTLPYEQPILAEIEGWVLAGGEALVPAQPVALQTWNGVGYLLVDPATGGARYQLAGALSGGSTAAPPDQVVQEFGLELWPPTRHPVNPDPASVVALRKLEGFDGAEGTVGETLATELRVEAVDVHGARVAGVPVRFTSVAGGGSLLDAAGAAHQELWVATDDHGIAAAGFRLGTDTGANPVYALLEPDDEHATRALLHLVDAVGQGVDGGGGTIELPIPEPFWAAAFPGEPVLLRRTDTTATHFHGLVAQWSDTIFVAVEDGYGNPVSNVPVTFQVGPMNLEAACSNELPEPERVNAAVFDNSSSGGQPACGGHPVLGSCGGPTLTRQTSFLGTTAGVIEGNVVAATYFVEVGAPGLDPLAFSYGHSWTIDGTNQACDTPDRLRISSLYLTDELGRNVNAAPAGQAFDWPVDFWIEAYVALPRPGDPPFYAAGQWLPACAGDLSLQVDNGGVPSAPVLDPADWSYRTTVTTGALPGLNQVTATASALSFCATGEPIDAALFADVNRVWGLSAEVTGFQPPIALLTGDGRLGEPLEVGYAVEPAAYHALSVDVEVLDKDAFASTVWPGTSRSGAGSATLPRGEPVEIEHDYAATVVVNRSHPAQVTSPEVALPLHQPIFADVTRFLRVSQELDVVNRTTCADHDVFSFHLNHPATVTLTVVRDTPTGPAPPEVLIHEMPLAEGDHAFSVSPASATVADLTLLPGSYAFTLHGVSQVVGHDETVDGVAISFFAMRDSLPVGHAMVKGVDLFDGHLVISREDLAVPGRGVPLGFERTYSSASAEPGHLGQGWTHSWLARVIETPCAELLVVGTEGSGMRFTPDGAGGWQPPRGHHGSLLLEDDTGVIDLYTTGGTHYRFLPVSTLAGEPLDEWYLDFVEDSSGNRTNLFYEEGSDGLPRVRRVVDHAGRELVFHYQYTVFQSWAGDVLTLIDGPDLLEVRFAYDGRGNLVEARRENGVRVEGYGYQMVGFRDLLVEVRNELNGAETSYQYSNEVLGLVGGAADIFLVERLTEPEGGVTRFFYDTAALAANGDVLTTWVRDPRSTSDTPPAPGFPDPYDTVYTLDHYGSPTAIADPIGGMTSIEWDLEHVVMAARTDANGVETTFSHDEHGNLLTETVTVTDVDGVDHSYQIVSTYHPPGSFDPPFIKNRLASRTDRNGATTSFGYDSAGRLTGSEITVHDAVGAANVLTTSHGYDPATGDRLSTTDPRGHTTSFGYDGFGNLVTTSTQVTSHNGVVETVETMTQWDILGRPVARTDPRGHVTTFEHDSLGRLVRTVHPEVEVDDGVLWQPEETVAYDDAANTVTSTDGNGHVTVSTFDLEGRLVRIANSVGGTREIGYDAAGNKVLESSWFDPATPRFDTFYAYDAAGRLVRRDEPEGRVTEYGYDPVGNLVSETLSDGSPGSTFTPRVTSHAHDQLNRRIRTVRDPAGLAAATEWLLDGEGNPLRVTDAEGRQSFGDHDELGRLVETRGPEWRPGQPTVVRFFHDGNGNVVRELRLNQHLEADGSWSDADQERLSAHDELDRLIVATDAEGGQRRLCYDPAGNLVEEIDPRGHRTSHGYDALSRQVSTTLHLSDPVTGAPWDVVTTRIFDAAGNLLHEDMPNGNRVSHTYDAADRLVASADRIGPLAAFAYDARGNRVREADGNGHETVHELDRLNRIIRSDHPEGRVVRFGWDVAGNQVFHYNPTFRRTDLHFDALDRLVLTEYPEIDGVRSTSSSTWDLVGNRLSDNDPRGNTTTYVVDQLDRVVEVIAPPLAGQGGLQLSSTTTYDAIGNAVADADRRGIPSRRVVDRENRVVESYRDGVLVASATYDAAGNPAWTTDANGNLTHTVFDERNLPIRIERPEQSVTRLFRDSVGDVVREVDGEGVEVTRGFDLRRRLAAESNGEGETTTYGYDFADNLTTIQRPLGAAWTWTRIHDEANRLLQVIDPLGNTTSYQYNGQDSVITIVDANRVPMVYDYDELERLETVRYPDATTRSFGYDPNGNLISTIDAKGQEVTSSFDELDREVLRGFSAPADPVGEVLVSFAFTWDANSNLVDAVETFAGGTRTTHHEWDRFDRLDRVTDGFGKVLDYGYDLNGNRTSLVDPDGALTTYTYDGLNRVDTVTLPGGSGAADFDWTRNGLLRRISHPNGVVSDFGYDDAHRVTSIDHADAGGAAIATYAYAYDANGNRSLQTEVNGGALETTTYAYDVADRLWRIAYPDRTDTYTFDAVGNRLTEVAVDAAGDPILDRDYGYDNRHRLLSVDDSLDPTQSIAYAYDANGNQTGRSRAGAALAFRYDVLDRLLEVHVDSSPAWTFGYDFKGLRVSKWGAAGLLHATYDDHSLLQQHSALGDPVATYRYGPDRLLAVDHFSEGRAAYHLDALGSPIVLTDPTGTPVNRSTYDAWGNYRSQTATHWNPFGFTGHEYDPETDLYYAKARFYDPEVGRFLTEDPAEPDLTTPPSLHRYLYAYGNPTVYWDPDGRQAAISEMQALQAAEAAARAYPEIKDKRLDEFDLIENRALRALAASGITDPLGQRAFLVTYAGETLGTNFEAASALTTHILGPIQPWEFEGKDWTRQMTEVKLEWAQQSEFIHTWGYIYINLWLMTVGAGEGAMEMPITTQQKLVTGASRLEMTAGSAEGLAPLAPRNTPGGPGRSGGTSLDPVNSQPPANQLRDLPPVRAQCSSQIQARLGSIEETVVDGSLRRSDTGQNLVRKAFTDLKTAIVNEHRSLSESYTWGAPPGGHWSQGVGHQTRLRLGLVGTEKELHHWLIPQRATWAPNYIKNQGWNLTVAANRAAHARIDTAFSVAGVKPYPLPIRPWMAMPNWARVTTVGTGAASGAAIAYWLAEGD